MTPTTPGASSSASTPMAHAWEYDVAANPQQHQQQDEGNINPSLDIHPGLNLTLQPAEFSPQELYQHSLPATSTSNSPTVIQLEERVPLVPSQYHRGRSTRKSAGGESRSRVQVDTAAAARASGPDRPATASPAAGPVRPLPAHGSRAHPYRRPHSAEDTVRAQSAGASTSTSSRRASDQSYVRFVQQDFAASGEASTGASASGGPQVGMGGSPGDSGLSRMSPPTVVPSMARLLLPPSQPTKVYNIRTDISYSSTTNTMTAMLELPGVKATDLSVTIATEALSKIRQITVAGRTRPTFAELEQDEREGRVRIARERKFGDFMRRLTVPPGTQASEVLAEMQDGILILNIPLGTPIPTEEPQIITIR